MKQRIGKTLLCMVVAAALVAADQIVKMWIFQGIRVNGDILVIPKLLNFTYVENYGAAFNIMMHQRWFLVVFGILISLGILGGIFYSFGEKEKQTVVLSWERACLVLILAGAVGNILDRMLHVYVIDFIQVLFIDFPVFNVADCFIVVGCILLFVLVLFIDKERMKENE